MFINIYIYSKNLGSINKFLKFITNKKIIKVLNFNIFSLKFQKKTKIIKFTVLKSPHVNKTAQEQFNYHVYRKQLTLNSYQIFLLLVYLKFIKFKLFTDIDIKIELNSNTTIFYNKLTKLFNSNNYSIRLNNYLFLNKYLQLFDIKGEILLNKKKSLNIF